MTWRSKVPWRGRAHFVVDGAALCAGLKLRDGTPMLAPFLSTWVDRVERDHLCSSCRREAAKLGDATVCRCGRCSIKVAAKAAR